MREINLNRQKLGLEDLLFGVGIVTQIRAGQNVDVTKINAGNLPFDETQSLLEWAQSINLEALGSMTTELLAIYDNLNTIGIVEDNLNVINTLEDNVVALQSLYTNISKLQNIDTNMSKLQNIDTNMSKLQNIDTNMSKLQAIYTDLTKLESIYDNLTMLLAIYNNLTALNNINSQVIPNLTELLLVNDNAIQVAADKLTVATDKGIVSGYKEDVSAMKVAVESIYDTFDDRFLGVKINDPILDNDGNALQDGAMYFNDSSNALKVYSLDNTTWYTIPQIYLSGLLDVTLTSITTGDILTWNGTKWVNTRTPSFDSVKLNGGTSTAGTATWNNTELTYDLVLNDNVTLQVGQEEVVYCKNNTLTTITNGKPVMAVGTNGNSGNILIALHNGAKASAKRIIGLTTQAILPSNNVNPYGFVTRNGKVRGLNTTGSEYGETWLDGDILYVKATGALTKVEPLDTELKMPIAFVIHAHSNGTLYVRTTGIDENHDRDLISTKIPKITTPTTKAVPRIKADGTLENSAITIDDSGNIGTGTQTFNGFGGSGGFKNKVINGNFCINNYARLPYILTPAANLYIDCFGGANSGTGTITMSADTITHNGKDYDAIKATATTAVSLGTDTRYFTNYTALEAKNISEISAGAMCLSFLFECSRAGIYSVAIAKYEADGTTVNSSYVTSFTATIGSQKVIIPIPANSFKVLKNNSKGIAIQIGFVTNIANTITNVDGWNIGAKWMKQGSLEWANTIGAYIKVGNVQLEEGLVPSPYEGRLQPIEEILCFRYNKTIGQGVAWRTIGSGGTNTGTYLDIIYELPIVMRASPTLTLLGALSSFQISDGFTTYTPTAIYIQDVAGGFVNIRCTYTGGVAGRLAKLTTINSNSGIRLESAV